MAQELLSMLSVLRTQHPGSPSAVEAEEFGVGYAIRRAAEAGATIKFCGVVINHYADYPGLVDLYNVVGTTDMIPVVGDVG